MFFVGEDGSPLVEHEEPDRPRPTLAEWLGVVPTEPPIPDIDQTNSNLVPGMRPGQGVDAPRRTGFHEEILVTLHAEGRAITNVTVNDENGQTTGTGTARAILATLENDLK